MKKALIASLFLNLLLAGGLIYVFSADNPAVVEIQNSIGTRRVIDANRVRADLIERHGVDLVSDLTGRELINLAAEESSIQLDVEELEARWHLWTLEPDIRAQLDSGEKTEEELRAKLGTLVLLDQLSLNEFNPSEREAKFREFFGQNQRALEQIRLRHILMDSEKAAEEVAERLVAGVEFGPLAARYSLDPLTRDIGGDLGWKSRDDLREDLAPLLFYIPQGRASKPLATKYGWHIFLVEEHHSEYSDLRERTRRKWCEGQRPETLAGLRARFALETPTAEGLKGLLLPLPQRIFGKGGSGSSSQSI
jgi:parvulin-like peptidyl-prolyl cis-trans isomerase-like protein